MVDRRSILNGMVGLAIGAALRPAAAAQQPSAAETLNAPGPEMDRIARGVGLWDVTETFWAAPRAEPVTTTGLVAEPVMMGSLLQGVIRPPSDAAHRAVARTDMLTFNRVQGVWQYVSFDTSVPAGLMPATGVNAGAGEPIELTFEPFAFVLPCVHASGQLLRRTDHPVGRSRSQRQGSILHAGGRHRGALARPPLRPPLRLPASRLKFVDGGVL